MQTDGICEGPITKTNIGRLTNAIFVFTLLLLFKNVRLPSFADSLNQTSIDSFGIMQIPDLISFVNAFIIISMFWVITFHIFHQIQKIDRKFLYLHFLLLVMIIFIPITSHMYQIFLENSIIALFFHVNILLISIMIIAEWIHGKKEPGLLKKSCNIRKNAIISRNLYYVPVSAMIGSILALYDIPHTRNLYYITMMGFILDWVFLQHMNVKGQEDE